MAKKPPEKTKLIVIDSNGVIPELGGINGPIINPCPVPVSTLMTMIRRSRAIYEVNPNDYSDRVRLSIKNVTKDNFPEKNPVEKVNEAPKIKSNFKDKKKEVTVVEETNPLANASSDFTKK